MRSVVGVQVVAGRHRRGARPAGRVAAAAALGGLRDAGAVGLRRPHRAREPALLRRRARRARGRRRPGRSTTSGSADHADALCSRLSGGQEARVSLAAALLGDPEVLVLDEPTVGPRPGAARATCGTCSPGSPRPGATLLVSSHVMDEAVPVRAAAADARGRGCSPTTPPQALLERTGARRHRGGVPRLVRGSRGPVRRTAGGAPGREEPGMNARITLATAGRVLRAAAPRPRARSRCCVVVPVRARWRCSPGSSTGRPPSTRSAPRCSASSPSS